MKKERYYIFGIGIDVSIDINSKEIQDYELEIIQRRIKKAIDEVLERAETAIDDRHGKHRKRHNQVKNKEED